MKRFNSERMTTGLGVLMLIGSILLQQPVSAAPFGQGVFSADVPFGSLTSLSISLGGNVAMNLAPSGQNLSGSGAHTLTVTSTDVVGYRLYAYSPAGTSMTNGSSSIPASSNSTPSALALNTWGYNTNGSSNYVGMTTTPSLIKHAIGPFKTGDATTVTYGTLTDVTKGAGNYAVNVVYTAVAENY